MESDTREVHYGQLALSNFLQAHTAHQGLQPEHTLSLAGEVLKNFHSLDLTQVERFLTIIRSRFDVVMDYAQASPVLQVKQVAERCARILKKTSEYLVLAHERFALGQEQALFEAFEYLISEEEFLIGQQFLRYVWDEWYPETLRREPLQDTKKLFLSHLCRYALVFDPENIGLDILKILHGRDTLVTDQIIFSYKNMVVTPEDFEIVVGEAREYYLSGKTTFLYPGLLASLKIYILKQLQYIKKNNCIEPEMKQYIMNGGPQEGYDFDTGEGIDFVYLQYHILLAILFGEGSSADILLGLIETNPELCGLIADILTNFSFSVEEQESYMEMNDILVEIFYPALLTQFDALEYQELHKRIQKHIEGFAPKRVAPLLDELQGMHIGRMHRFNTHGDIQRDYLALSAEFDARSSAIMKRHLHIYVLSGAQDIVFENSLFLAYYSIDYYLLHGKWPIIPDSTFYNIKRQQGMTTLENRILSYAFPDQY